FNQPTPIVDGNVIRVLARFFGIDGDPRERRTNRKLWSVATGLVDSAEKAATSPHWRCSRFNQALMELGALVCTPTQPKCEVCPVRAGCVAHRTGRIEVLPALRRRTPSVRRRFAAFVLENRGLVLVRRRPA